MDIVGRLLFVLMSSYVLLVNSDAVRNRTGAKHNIAGRVMGANDHSNLLDAGTGSCNSNTTANPPPPPPPSTTT